MRRKGKDKMALLNRTKAALALVREGSYQGESDVLDHVLFDTLNFQTSATATYLFFQQGQGTGKTATDTNLTANGQLPSGNNFLIQRLGFHLIPNVQDATPEIAVDVVRDFYCVMENSLIEIVVRGREFDFQAPGSLFLPNIAISQKSDGLAATPSYVGRVGDYNAKNWIALNTPIALEALASFNLKMAVNTSNVQVAAALGRLAATGAGVTLPAALRWQLGGTLERSK